MVEIKIELGKKSFQFDLPQSWDQVPEHLYPFLARIYLRDSRFMNENDKLVRTLAILMDGAIGALDLLTDYQILDLTKMIHWVYEKLDLKENKIISFTLDEIDYLGPSSDLSNMRFGEFIMAETYFMQYTESRMENSIYLDKLIAALYRPHGLGPEYSPGDAHYRGDWRQKFNSNLIDSRASIIKDLDLAIKDGIYLFYAVARDSLFSYYPNVFPKRKSSSKQQNVGQINFGWIGVFDDMLGEKGRTAESLEDEFLSTALMSLERNQIKIKEINKKKH